MKAERRHELHQNELVRVLEQSRDFFNTYGKYIAGGIIVVALAYAGVRMLQRSRQSTLDEAWRQKEQLVFTGDVTAAKESLEKLARLTRESSDESFVLMGLIDQGTIALRKSAEAATPPDRELNQVARAAFEELLRRFPNNPLALGVGHCGLATVEANEFVLDGDVAHKDRARRHLETVQSTELLNGTPYQTRAIEQLARLDKVFTPVVFAPPLPPEPPTPQTETPPSDAEQSAPMEDAVEPQETQEEQPSPEALEPAEQPDAEPETEPDSEAP